MAAERLRRIGVEMDSSSDATGESSQIRETRVPEVRLRRKRSYRAIANDAARDRPIPSSATSRDPPGGTVKIKTEEEIHAIKLMKEVSRQDKVAIYVGESNAMFTVAREDLAKSPILNELISDVSASGPFIMHPELTKIPVDHFQAVFYFLVMDEYTPAIVSNPLGLEHFPKRLDGLTSVDAYRKEAIRAGHLYVIAKGLEMKSMEDLIFRKITQAEYEPYGVKCLLDLAKIVFSRPEESELATKGKRRPLGYQTGADQGSDPLEEWLIDFMKKHLQRALVQHAQLFFEIANHGACAKRGFGIRIFKGKVEEWEAQGAMLAIEDDDDDNLV